MGQLSILCVIWKFSQVNRKSNIKVKKHNVHYLFLHTLASTRKMIRSHLSLLQMSISKKRCWLSCDWQIELADMSRLVVCEQTPNLDNTQPLYKYKVYGYMKKEPVVTWSDVQRKRNDSIQRCQCLCCDILIILYRMYIKHVHTTMKSILLPIWYNRLLMWMFKLWLMLCCFC